MNLWLSQSGLEADKQLRIRLHGGLIVDGVFGTNTLVATERFQRESGHRATAVVGLSAWKLWIGAEVTPSGGINTGRGEFGGFVGWWQVSLNRWLREHHRAELVVDCWFGAQTAAATRVFQQAVHVPATGNVDRRTFLAAQRLNLTHLP
jgi:peptidoglycan hydrolase-like protein with peptidoglycan-binding domain